MKHLVIIGAGGLGREVFSAAKNAVGYGTEFDIKGFLDANAKALDGKGAYAPILGTPEAYMPVEGDVFITAQGNVALHRKLSEMLAEKGAEFISIVHRSAWLEDEARLGKDCYVAHNAVVSVNATLCDHVQVLTGAVVGHDSVLKPYAHVFGLSFIGGGCTIGEGATLYPGVRVVPGRTVGDHAVVGVGSVVFLNVAAATTVVGNPARRMPN